MRAAVLRDVEPEIFGPSHVESQSVVFAGAFSNQDLFAVNLQCSKSSGSLRWFIVRFRGDIRSSRNLARNRMPGIPVLDRLQSPGLLIEPRPPIPYFRNLLRDDRLSPAGLVMPLEHLVDVFSEADRGIERYFHGPRFLSEIVGNLHGLIMLFHLHAAR